MSASKRKPLPKDSLVTATAELYITDSKTKAMLEPCSPLTEVQKKRKEFRGKYKQVMGLMVSGVTDSLKESVQSLHDEECNIRNRLRDVEDKVASSDAKNYEKELKKLNASYDATIAKIDEDLEQCSKMVKTAETTRILAESYSVPYGRVKSLLAYFSAYLSEWRKVNSPLMEAFGVSYGIQMERVSMAVTQLEERLEALKDGARSKEELEDSKKQLRDISVKLKESRLEFELHNNQLQFERITERAPLFALFQGLGKVEFAREQLEDFKRTWNKPHMAKKRTQMVDFLEEIELDLVACEEMGNDAAQSIQLNANANVVLDLLKQFRRETLKIQQIMKPSKIIALRHYISDKMKDDVEYFCTTLVLYQSIFLHFKSCFKRHNRWPDEVMKELVPFWKTFNAMIVAINKVPVSFCEQRQRLEAQLPVLSIGSLHELIVNLECKDESFGIHTLTNTIIALHKEFHATFHSLSRMRPIWVKRVKWLISKIDDCKSLAEDKNLKQKVESLPAEEKEEWTNQMEVIMKYGGRLRNVKNRINNSKTMVQMDDNVKTLEELFVEVNASTAKFADMKAQMI